MNSSPVFRPVVGKNCHQPESPFRGRTLILGGSHYHSDPKVVRMSRADLRREYGDFTEFIVGEYLDPERFENWIPTFSKLINSVYNRGTDQSERDGFFDSVIFYNYAQEFAGGDPTQAHSIDYAAPENHESFLEVLRTHQPEFVIAWGLLLWNALRNNWGYGEADRTPLKVWDSAFDRHYVYPWEGRKITLIGTTHPSGGYASKRHHEIFLRAGWIDPLIHADQ